MSFSQMHETPKSVSRKVIPRWRNLRLTPQNEVGGVGKPKLEKLDIASEFVPLREKWLADPTLNNAAEILFLSSFGQIAPETEDAAKFVLNDPSSSAELKAFASSVVMHEQASPSQMRDSFKDNPIIYRGQIRSYRKRLIEYPRDPIGHVELARIYASIGQSGKAKEHFRVAIGLASTSRFVLRSAARFYVHEERFDEALRCLRQGPKNDPWLVAAEISIADLSGKPIENWRKGKWLLENVGDPAQIAELAAASGTVELKSGKINLARKLFKAAARSPNDNVVAQLQWASRHFGFHFDDKLLSHGLTFEAATAHALRAEKWSEAVEACLKWMFDEPFSARPAMEGGFLASTALKDYPLAQMFLRQGLLANPQDAGMLNNLAYSLIMTGDFIAAEEEIVKAQKYANFVQREVVLPATLGLLAYRKKDELTGAEYYLKSMAKAHELKEFELMHHAYLNFCFEELRIGHSTPIIDGLSVEQIYTGEKINRRTKVLYELILKPMLSASRQWGQLTQTHIEYRGLLDHALLSEPV